MSSHQVLDVFPVILVAALEHCESPEQAVPVSLDINDLSVINNVSLGILHDIQRRELESKQLLILARIRMFNHKLLNVLEDRISQKLIEIKRIHLLARASLLKVLSCRDCLRFVLGISGRLLLVLILGSIRKFFLILFR